jgi:hypothetical protein
MALTKLVPTMPVHARALATICGVANALLLYVLIIRCFRRIALGFAAALILLFTPTHVLFSHAATPEGIWQVPFILAWAIGMTALADRPSGRTRALFAAGAVALAASTYSQPSAALMMPMFAIATAIAFCSADAWRIRDALFAAAAFVTALLPMLIWFARFPGTYPDTIGRWVLHPAHLRNPMVWLQTLSNWHRDANVAALFWDFFAPSHLFLTPAARGLCGVFLTPTIVPIAVGVFALIRRDLQDETLARMRPVIVACCLVPPLAAAMFDSARSIDRAVVVVPFGIFLAVWGASVAWRRGGPFTRGILAIAAAAAGLQAFLCVR